jgi:tetratricopeptide (TPR) repeat protein
MKRKCLLVGAVIMLLFAFVGHLLREASAQEERKLDLVGVTRQESKSGVKVQLRAVIIGISLYEVGDQTVNGYRISNLKYAADDAQSMYDFLRSNRGGSFPQENIKLLKDEQATRANLQEALDWLKQSEPNDYFVIFLAAHGAIGKSKKEPDSLAPYFVLYDTRPDDLPNTAIDMRVLREMVEKDLPAKGLVICDTCHSAGVIAESARGESISVPAAGAFKRLVEEIPRGVGFILAAGQLEASLEKDSLYHGVFTYCLLEALRGEADANHDGIVNFAEAGTYLTEEVPRLSGNQHVQVLPNTIEANDLPLSLVRYTVTDKDNYAALVIRNPNIDGLEVTIDRKITEELRPGIESTVMVTDGPHKLEFFKDNAPVGELTVTPNDGRFTEVYVKLTFSETDGQTGPQRQDLPVSFYLPEKELSNEARKLYQEGIDSFDQQKFEDAIRKFDLAIGKNKGAYQRALVYRGRAQQSLNRNNDAVKSFEDALKLKKSDFETETLLAEAKFGASGTVNVTEVIGSLKDIIRRYPDYSYARVVLGDLLFANNNIRGAERELRHAIALNPNSPPAHMILANILAYSPTKSKRLEAIDEAKKALVLFEDIANKKVTFKRASVLHLIFGGARYVNESALAEAHYILAKTYVNAVEFDPAISDRGTYLQEAAKSLLSASGRAEKFMLRQRFMLVHVLKVHLDMLNGDTASAIKNGEQALKEGGPQARAEMKGFIHALLSRAYESDQNISKHNEKAVEHQQEYIDICGPRLSADKLKQAQDRLAYLKTKIADRRR